MTESIKEQLFAKLSKPRSKATTFGGLPVHIKHWTEREKFEVYTQNKGGSDDLIRCRTIALAVCDADRNLVFSLDEQNKLADFPASEVEKLFEEIAAFNQAPAIEEAIEDAKKN